MLRLNADIGELPARQADGSETALVALLDEANIACGGHAGDASTMAVAVAACVQHGVAVGAHPGYPDRAGFGRVAVAMTDAALAETIVEQVRALAAVARAQGVQLAHIKPHGALYHDVGGDLGRARVLTQAWRALLPEVGPLPVVLFAGARTAAALTAWGVPVVGEVFADRGLDARGQLLPRGSPGAVLGPDEAARQAARLLAVTNMGHAARDHRAPSANAVRVRARTLCVHGDGPEALAVARAVRAVLGPRAPA